MHQSLFIPGTIGSLMKWISRWGWLTLGVGCVLWAFPVSTHAISISGTVYTDTGSTAMGAGRTVSISVSGAAVTATGSTLTNSDGTYTLTGINVAAGTVITIYLNDNVEQGVVYATAGSSDMTGMNIYQNYLVIRSNFSTTNEATARGNGDADITALNSSLFNYGKSLYIPAGVTHSLTTVVSTFTVGGKLVIDGTLRRTTTSGTWSTMRVGALINNGTLDVNTSTGSPSFLVNFIISGDFINAGTFTSPSTSQKVVTLRGSGSHVLQWGSGFKALVLNAGVGTYTLRASMTLTTPVGGTTVLTLSGGTLDVSPNNYGITLFGNLVTTHGTLNARNGTLTFSSGLVSSLNASGFTVYNLVHNANAQFQLSNNGVTILNNFYNSTGTFHANKLPVTVGGTMTMGTGTYIASAALKTFGALSIQGGTFRGGTGSIVLNGTLTQTGGTFLAPTGSFTVSGDWRKGAAGTFSASGATVTLNGANQTLSGSTTFYNLSKTVSTADTLSFEAGSTQTIANTLTLQGAASNLLSLRSTTTGSVWNIDPQGTRTLAYLDVRDSTNANATAIVSDGNNMTDSGNNTNWGFAGGGGSSSSSSSAASSSGDGAVTATPHGGYRGSPATMAQRITAAKNWMLARFFRLPEAPEDDSSAPVSSAAPKRIVLTQLRGKVRAFIHGEWIVFSDVSAHEWYTPYVSYLLEQGIAHGYQDAFGKLTGEFGIANAVTYAEVLKMSMEAAGIKPMEGGSPRNLSAKGTWVSSYVAEAEKRNISLFTPSLNVHEKAPRGAAVHILLNVLAFDIGKTPSTFRDVPKDSPFSTAIALAAFYGFIAGDTTPQGIALNIFRPNDFMNRAELAKIVALAREMGRG
jgi:hypothetical protein